MATAGLALFMPIVGGLTAWRLIRLSPAWLAGEPRTFAECWPILKGELVRPWRLLF